MDIALALSGGGAKGFAHLGVLKVLEREGVHVRALAGASMGGMIGSLFAAGHSPAAIEESMAALARHPPFERTREEGPAIKGLSGVSEALGRMLGDTTFDDLSIPFAVTAVDIKTAKLLALRHGLVCDAVLATIAIPGVFPPMEWNGRLLVDGTVLDPVPVALARSLAPDLPVIAVTLAPSLDHWEQPSPPRLLVSLPFLGKYLARSRLARSVNLFLSAVDISHASVADLRLQIDRPDVTIRPDVHQVGLLDAVEIGEVAVLGEKAAEEALFEIRGLGDFSIVATRYLRRWRLSSQRSRYGTLPPRQQE